MSFPWCLHWWLPYRLHLWFFALERVSFIIYTNCTQVSYQFGDIWWLILLCRTSSLTVPNCTKQQESYMSIQATTQSLTFVNTRSLTTWVFPECLIPKCLIPLCVTLVQLFPKCFDQLGLDKHWVVPYRYLCINSRIHVSMHHSTWFTYCTITESADSTNVQYLDELGLDKHWVVQRMI